MDTKALRQKILDLAIRGKLVPQDPSDEPASVLLERIREQKKQMVKEGKLKAKDIMDDTIIFVGEDNLHYEKFADGTVKCIEEEIPFEVPEGWEWTRLQSITSILTDGTHKTPTYSEDGYIFLSSKNVTSGKIDWSNIMYIPESLHQELYSRLAPKIGDILLAKNGTTGVAAIVDREEVFDIYVSLALIRVVENIIDPLYILNVIGSSFAQDYFSSSLKGIGVPNLHLEHIRNTLIPIPPCLEQARINSRTDMLLPLAGQIEENREELKRLVSFLKSKILDLAIRGKLVPQDPNDEPASVLLERIRTEKEELIKQGKIKRDKKESIIFRGDDNSYYEKIDGEVSCIDEEIPYDIPDTWTWMRLENCCVKEIRRGKSPKYAEISNVIVFAQKCNTKYNGIDISLAQYLDETTIKRYPTDEHIQDGDIVINSTGTGTLGRVGIYRNTDNTTGLLIVPDSHVTVIRSFSCINSHYLYAFMKAHQTELEKKGEGSTNQKELKPLTLKEMLIAVPPLSEQKRIDKSINVAFSHLAIIEKSLN